MNQGERRAVKEMPYRRRQDGKTAIERREETKLWGLVVGILTVLVGLAVNPANAPQVAAAAATVAGLMTAAPAMRTVVWDDHAPIDHVSFYSLFIPLLFVTSSLLKTNDSRDINSFADEDCWRFFRFRKPELRALVAGLNIPAVFQVEGAKNGFVSGESSFI